MKRFFYFLSLAFLLSLSVRPLSGQIIESMEEALENGISSSGDLDAGDVVAFVDFFVDVGFYPTWGTLVGFPGEPGAWDALYADYPYDDGYSGLYRPFGEDGSTFRGQFLAHFQSNEDAFNGGFFQLKISPTPFLTLDLNQLRLYEKRFDTGQTDRLTITNFNAHYQRVRHRKFVFWWGGGLMLLDGEELWGSPSVTGGLTWFFKRPLSFYADIQAGWPDGVPSQLYQMRMQAHWNRLLFYGGYSGVSIGGTHEPSWAFGMGVYF